MVNVLGDELSSVAVREDDWLELERFFADGNVLMSEAYGLYCVPGPSCVSVLKLVDHHRDIFFVRFCNGVEAYFDVSDEMKLCLVSPKVFIETRWTPVDRSVKESEMLNIFEDFYDDESYDMNLDWAAEKMSDELYEGKPVWLEQHGSRYTLFVDGFSVCQFFFNDYEMEVIEPSIYTKCVWENVK